MTSLPSAPADGQSLRDSAFGLLRIRRQQLIRQCSIAAIRHGLLNDEVTSDDVRAVVPIPLGINPKLIGAVFNGLATAGILKRTGSRNSVRPESHARPISVWQLVDVSAAKRWLRGEEAAR
jgi:hypothetical protein